MILTDQTIQNFLADLASKNATPGGGSVAALNGAMGAALVSMVCNLTIGKKKYADVETDAQAILQKSKALRAELTNLITQDISAFNKVMTAYGLPRESQEEKQARTEAIQAALKEATLVPLTTARACAQVLALCKPMAEIGNLSSVSDVGSGAMAAYAGLKSAALNVFINLGGIKDEAFVSEVEAELNEILANQADLVEEVYLLVKSRI